MLKQINDSVSKTEIRKTVKIKEQNSNLKVKRSKLIFFKAERVKVKDESFTKSLGNVLG